MKNIRLSKNLILIGLVLTMLFTFAVEFTTPLLVNAQEIVTEEENDSTAHEVFHVGGVHRDANLQTNQEIFSETVMSIAKVVFAFVVFIVIILTGINAIINCYDGKSRAEIIEKFKHVIYGVLLFAVATLIVALATSFQDKLLQDLYNVQTEDTIIPNEVDDTFDTNWLANLLEMGLKIIGKFLEYILDLLYNVLSFNVGPGAINQYTLNDILFMEDFGDQIDINAINVRGMQLSTAPFTIAQWDRYTSAYFLLATIAVPIMLIALIKAAYDMIINAGNFEKAMEVKKTSMRIVAGVIIVVLGPYLFRTVLTFFNMLVFLIPVEYEFDIVVEDISEANGLLTVFTALWWLWIKFRIMLLFVVREIMLTVMYIVTPVVIGFWTLSEKTKVFNKWIGETITNAATQFCYAMVFFIATIVLNGSQTNAFFTLLWMSMMLKLADFFKESFQNLFDKWSGINELQVADGMAGKISGFAVAAGVSSAKTFDSNGTTRYSQFWDTVTGVHRFLTKGDITEISTRANRLKAKNKDDLSSNAEDISSISTVLSNNYKGYNDEWSKYLQDSFTTLEITEGYAGYDDRLLSIPSFDGSGYTNDRLERIARKGYYKDNVQSLFEGVNWSENPRVLEDLANRASSLDVQRRVSTENESYYNLAEKLHKLSNERAGFIIDKAAIKYKRDQELVPSVNALGKEAAKGTVKKYVKDYIADPSNELRPPVKAKPVELKFDPNLISIKLGGGSSSQVSVSDAYAIKSLQAKNAALAEAMINKEMIERERTEIETKLSESIRVANNAIKNQEAAKNLPQEKAKQILGNAISSSAGALEGIIGVYEANGAKLDSKLKTMLMGYADALGAYGLSKEQGEFIARINNISKN